MLGRFHKSCGLITNLFGENSVCEEVILGKVKVQSETHWILFAECDLDVLQEFQHWLIIFLHTARPNTVYNTILTFSF